MCEVFLLPVFVWCLNQERVCVCEVLTSGVRVSKTFYQVRSVHGLCGRKLLMLDIVWKLSNHILSSLPSV